MHAALIGPLPGLPNGEKVKTNTGNCDDSSTLFSRSQFWRKNELGKNRSRGAKKKKKKRKGKERKGKERKGKETGIRGLNGTKRLYNSEINIVRSYVRSSSRNTARNATRNYVPSAVAGKKFQGGKGNQHFLLSYQAAQNSVNV
ncbi:hypothetical protein POVCU2_0002500 [Plasmodium ovale curtisi]|uniref:Uncharacterized protein n=1 Tax=Plasmodium ovale curtisi TaxID=864141 RepID=A0A1A8VHZ3_PLAOA|nr:hypothetical protein POVCU2_0002500 [Plasmodium ovale curtisi]